MRAFVRATWLLDDWDLLSKEMDVRVEFADIPFLTGKALADRMRGEEIFITTEDPVDEEALGSERDSDQEQIARIRARRRGLMV
jgi:hypothetical protein